MIDDFLAILCCCVWHPLCWSSSPWYACCSCIVSLAQGGCRGWRVGSYFEFQIRTTKTQKHNDNEEKQSTTHNTTSIPRRLLQYLNSSRRLQLGFDHYSTTCTCRQQDKLPFNVLHQAVAAENLTSEQRPASIQSYHTTGSLLESKSCVGSS
jgi:hypothetical protein